MTPLIDVLLVLLIIFMVLPTSFGERAEIPQAKSTQPISDGPPVVIQLVDGGQGIPPRLKINHDPVAWQTLESKLEDIYSRRIERIAFLKGDPEVDFQYVAQVVDMAHHAGVDHIGLLGAGD